MLGGARIIPVVTCDDEAAAVAIARALLAGGIAIMELTLRSARALPAITAVRHEVPAITVGAGTVLSPRQWDLAAAAGAQFMVSPGTTEALLQHAAAARLPYLPGVSTCSDVMRALDHGFDHLKLFPAGAVGGLAFLEAAAGPFANVRFCPTGGVDAVNYRDYLAAPQVFAVGGSWLVPQGAVARGAFAEVTTKVRAAQAGL